MQVALAPAQPLARKVQLPAPCPDVWLPPGPDPPPTTSSPTFTPGAARPSLRLDGRKDVKLVRVAVAGVELAAGSGAYDVTDKELTLHNLPAGGVVGGGRWGRGNRTAAKGLNRKRTEACGGQGRQVGWGRRGVEGEGERSLGQGPAFQGPRAAGGMGEEGGLGRVAASSGVGGTCRVCARAGVCTSRCGKGEAEDGACGWGVRGVGRVGREQHGCCSWGMPYWRLCGLKQGMSGRWRRRVRGRGGRVQTAGCLRQVAAAPKGVLCPSSTYTCPQVCIPRLPRHVR